MNSEELERSLKTEFENYLTNALAEMRGQMSGLQEKLEAEIEKHKSQIEDVVREFTERLAVGPEIDEGFNESVVEHLRLSRDEGARITAEAIAEAEKMDEKPVAEPLNYAALRDAVSEITEQDSQADILKTLINRAAEFTPRGAFFIIKNDHFVGWRTFGKEGAENDAAIREIFFPVSAETVLGESVRSLTTVETGYGTYSGDTDYLNKLDFGQPDRMYAIPLMARGRGVAVLYADYGQEGTRIDIEALETLVRVAGMTVELLAATRRVKSESAVQKETVPAKQAESVAPRESVESPRVSGEQTDEFAGEAAASEIYSPVSSSPEEFAEETDQTPSDQYAANYAPTQNYAAESATDNFESADGDRDAWNTQTENYDYAETQESGADSYAPAPVNEDFGGGYPASSGEQAGDFSSDYQTPTSDFQMPPTEDYSSPATSSDYQFENTQPQEPAAGYGEPEPAYGNQTANAWSYNQNDYTSPATDSHYAPAVEEPPPTDVRMPDLQEQSAPGFDQPVETQPASQPSTAAPVRTRFNDRNIDLPIEVPDEERRLHNDARRFARLLISEIKLYNEQKVKEGRDSQDIYERLREAIDRSREMYDKRVQPPVAAKFDYFHYELVNTLAEGDEHKLGASYPGALV